MCCDLFKRGSKITVGGFAGNMSTQRDVERNSLITLNGQPTTKSRAQLFDIIETRCAIIAEAHVRGEKHGISVRRVPHNAHAELRDAEHTWDLAHSTNSTVLSTFTKKFRGDQLSLLSRSWGTTARRTDGTAAPAPSLPDVSKGDFGDTKLTDFTLAQLRGQKSKKAALSDELQEGIGVCGRMHDYAYATSTL